jgi:biopolymer transport protein ExbD
MAFKLLDSTEEDDSLLTEINITPLTDIFLVLLIIFMVTSSVMSQLGVDVDLPTGGAQVSESDSEGVIVTLLPDGAMRINDQTVPAQDWETLKELMKQAFKLTASRVVILEGDRKAFLGNAIELMDQAKSVGAQKFAIATSGNKK